MNSINTKMKRNNGRQTDRQKKKQVSVWWLLGEN